MALADSKDMAKRTLRIDCHVCHVLELPGFVWLHNSLFKGLSDRPFSGPGQYTGKLTVASLRVVQPSKSVGLLGLCLCCQKTPSCTAHA
ncbi:Uncharacterized protein HZ326_4926 [Fusarium oxysporum f. sp. albedinis]|nr:Uncharacterized protein HZ326_4926 [Fusarium oxysporum f. sp. albedinis]